MVSVDTLPPGPNRVRCESATERQKTGCGQPAASSVVALIVNAVPGATVIWLSIGVPGGGGPEGMPAVHSRTEPARRVLKAKAEPVDMGEPSTPPTAVP